MDLRSTIETAIQRHTAAADERQVSISTNISDDAFETDPVLWQAIVGNLIGNAVEYAPRQSTVEVEASSRALRVANIAPNLAPADIGSLFDRFWRKDTARTGTHHSGLGLSIVQNCALLLGGTCRAELSPSRELRIEIQWDGKPQPQL